tara:strand:+ start:93 stop:386 length:294 start_codon:yes stop_codon:yes gene_type:complete
MFSFVKNILKKKVHKPHELNPGSIYAVLHGVYVGEMLVYIETTINKNHFLSIPKMINREIPMDKWKLALDNNIVEFVESIPKQELQVCSAQYKHNKQ